MTKSQSRGYFTLTTSIIIVLLLLKQCGPSFVQNNEPNTNRISETLKPSVSPSEQDNNPLTKIKNGIKLYTPIKNSKMETLEIKLPAILPSTVFTSISLIVEGISSDDVYAIINEESIDSTKIDWKPLQESLVKLVPLWKIEELNPFLEYDANKKITWIEVRKLKSKGYFVKYDAVKQEITVWVSGDSKSTRDISLTNTPDQKAVNSNNTAVSGFVNIFANKSHQSGELYSSQNSSQPPGQVFLDANLNIKDFVFQATGSVLEGSGYQRQDLLVSKDDDKNSIRYTVGDIATPQGGYLSAITVGGVGLRRDNSINPYKILTPISEFEVLLKTNAILAIELNGHQVFEKRLDSGKYDIRNFPFTGGVNHAVIVVMDPITRAVIDELKLTPFSYASEILRKGHSEFNYAAGKKRIDNGLASQAITNLNATEIAGRYYDNNGATAVLTHKYGLLDRVTIGGYAQIENNYNLTGESISMALPYGILTFESAYSNNQKHLTRGTATKLEYRFNISNFTTNLGLEKRFFEFSQASETFSSSSIDRAAYWGIGFPITNTLSSSYSGRESFDKGNNLTWQHSVSLSNAFSSRLQSAITGTLTKSDPQSNQVDTDVFLTLTYSFGSGNVFSQTDLLAKTAQVDATYSQSLTRDTDYGISGGLGINSSGQTSSVGAVYHGEKESINLSNSLSSANGLSGNITSASLSTAFAFADNVATITKPISGSFALFKGYDAFSGEKVMINPSNDFTSSLMETDFLGVAAVSTSPYINSEFTIGLPELKDGLYIEKEYFTFRSTYKSGTLIKIKNVLTSSISGTLLDKNGKPADKVSGEMRPINGKVIEEPVFFFTNSNGVFSIDGLKNFLYELKFFGEDAVMEIKVPGPEAGRKDLGEIHAPFGD